MKKKTDPKQIHDLFFTDKIQLILVTKVSLTNKVTFCLFIILHINKIKFWYKDIRIIMLSLNCDGHMFKQKHMSLVVLQWLSDEE